MKKIILILFLIIPFLGISKTIVKKDGSTIKVGDVFYLENGSVFYNSGDRVYIQNQISGLNVYIGEYSDIITKDSTSFPNALDCIEYLNSLTIVKPYNYSISFGEVDHASSVYKFGRNVSVGTTEEVIWDGGGEYQFIDEADYLEVFSSNDNDSLGGANAWSLVVYGLDSSFNEISEVVELAGTTIVTTNQKFRRTYRAFVLNAGTTTTTNGNNIGDITIRKATGDTIQAQVLAGNGQTLMCVYTVPKGFTGYLTGYSLGSGEGKQVVFKSKFRNCMTNNCAFTVKDIREIFENTFLGELATPLVIPEMTDIVITGQVAAGDASASASFGMILRKD